MKASQVARSLAALIAVDQPTMIWGPPGAGKSSVVAQVAKAYGGEFIDMRLPLYDAVDLRGIPTVKDGRTHWLTPARFPKPKTKGVIFLDELPQALPIVQAAASQLILDRRIDEYELPKDWRIIAAGNRDTDRAATNRMPSHIANRFTHLQFEVSPQDWHAWAEAHGISPVIIAFLSFKPGLLHNFDPKAKENPTPRSWEFVHKILDGEPPEDCLLELVAGTVGEAAATEFMGFIRVFRELPDFDTIRKRPEGCNVPQDISVKYAVAQMLAKLTQPEHMPQIMKYVARLPAEFQILATQEMTKANKALAETSSYIKWVGQNQDLLINATQR